MASVMMINFLDGSNNLIEAIITPREDAKVGDTFVTSGPEREKWKVVSIESDGFEQNCRCERVAA